MDIIIDMLNNLNELEKQLSSTWSYVGFKVGLSNHFHERFVDGRNHPSISISEFKRLMIKGFSQYGSALKKMAEDNVSGFTYNGIFKDIETNINAPFSVYLTNRDGYFKLNVKTVMRSYKFKTKSGDNILVLK